MSDRNVILALARVVVAAAWADGKLTSEEIDSLKDLLFQLPHVGPARGVELPAKDWQALEIYMHAPVDAPERARLVAQLQDALRSPADRALALEVLDALARADGAVSDEERAVLAEIRSALEAVDLGLVARIARMVRGPVRRHAAAVADAPNRDAELDDFVKNRVYFQVRRRLPPGALGPELSDDALRKLSLAGGLMARVASVDSAVTDTESGAIEEALRGAWGITAEASAAVADAAVSAVAAGLDYFRLTRSFFEATDDAERTRFLDVLFAVARADGAVSAEETAEIRRIAQSLNLSQQLVNAALDRARGLYSS
ncbi:MAG: hypothetical protein RLZZ387_5535 [Chloroflexota bacterium]